MSAPLRRFLRPPPRRAPGEQCEMCAEPLSERHSHVIDLDSRAILCTCRGCYLLFTRPGAGRHRAVPERYRYLADSPAGRQLRESAGIPVRMAFFFVNSRQDRPVAFYPSPAGATESLLPLAEWDELRAEFDELEPDVEALLVNGDETFLVPIDVCYELVGLVKLSWRGFDGGTAAWQAIDGFFAQLRGRSAPAGASGG